MAVSTTEVVLILIFGLGLIVVLWMYYVSHKHKQFISTQSYTRGANRAGTGIVSLVCDDNSEICVYDASQICTKPDGSNFESGGLDAMTSNGNLNPRNIVSRTNEMASACNGKTQCTWNFTASTFPAGPCGGDSHLISTYTCVAKGTCPPIQSS